jgi:hypothetical protein
MRLMAELLVLLSSRKQTFGERRLDEGTRGRYVGVLYLGRARALPSDDFDDWEKRAWAKRSSFELSPPTSEGVRSRSW